MRKLAAIVAAAISLVSVGVPPAFATTINVVNFAVVGNFQDWNHNVFCKADIDQMEQTGTLSLQYSNGSTVPQLAKEFISTVTITPGVDKFELLLKRTGDTTSGTLYCGI